MKTREIERALAAADPTGGAPLEGIALEAMEADLLADVEGGRSDPLAVTPPRRRGRSRRALVLAAGAAAVAVVLAVVLVLAGGGAGRPERAYGAELVRFAEEGPLLLLEGPGWRVSEVFENKTRVGIEGTMEFLTGKELPPESVAISGNDRTGQRETGLSPAAVRQRQVRLGWSHRPLAATLAYAHRRPHVHGQRWTKLPVLGTTAVVDERDELFVNQGGPGDRTMTAYWEEGGLLLELHAAVPDLAGLEERLDWITKVDLQSWLDALPEKVVKASEHGAVVREILRGVAVPPGFEPSMVRDQGLTTNHAHVAAEATSTVACLWMQQWGAARREGDIATEAEAERGMASSHRWPVLVEEAQEPRAGTPLIWEVADAMPRGYWLYRGHPQNLLKHAEGLGCARYGLPLLPEKQKLQEERGLPPAP